MIRIVDKPMRFFVRGERWTRRTYKKIRRYGLDCYGLCEYAKRLFRISEAQQSERAAFNTDLHEAAHAWFPDLAEECVTEFADEATVLFFDKLRYRRLPPE